MKLIQLHVSNILHATNKILKYVVDRFIKFLITTYTTHEDLNFPLTLDCYITFSIRTYIFFADKHKT